MLIKYRLLKDTLSAGNRQLSYEKTLFKYRAVMCHCKLILIMIHRVDDNTVALKNIKLDLFDPLK
jgi:hypothetical protein